MASAEAPVLGECLEPLGRHGIVDSEAGGLGATQRGEVAAAAQPLAEVAGDRADVRPGAAAQVDPDVEPPLRPL